MKQNDRKSPSWTIRSRVALWFFRLVVTGVTNCGMRMYCSTTKIPTRITPKKAMSGELFMKNRTSNERLAAMLKFPRIVILRLFSMEETSEVFGMNAVFVVNEQISQSTRMRVGVISWNRKNQRRATTQRRKLRVLMRLDRIR